MTAVNPAHSDSPADRPSRSLTGALLYGNFVIGVGVMIVPGMLNGLADALQVSVPVAGQLLSLAALVLCVGSPLAAALTSRVDRRVLLTASLALYGVGHLACALAPDYPTLAILRPLSVIGAAIYTPQAAATIGLLVPTHQRATAVTTVFLGWSLASVAGMPIGSLIAGHFSWRAGFVLVAVLAAASALWVWRVIPSGLTVPRLSLASWLQVARSPRLTGVLAVTWIAAIGQFIVLSYIAPALRDALSATPALIAMIMAVNGVSGVIGSSLMTRAIGRIGPDRAVRNSVALLAVAMLVWGCAATFLPRWEAFVLAVAFWGFGSFATNSAQQARLATSAPTLASASISLNSSGMYAGQAVGAAIGGVVIAGSGYWPLAWFALAVVIAAMAMSLWADRAEHPA